MAESLFCFKDIRSESDIKSSIHSSLISIVWMLSLEQLEIKIDEVIIITESSMLFV